MKDDNLAKATGPRPSISVITVTYNAAKLLQGLVASIEGQIFKDFEWVVMDGGSTDGTQEILRNAKFQNLNWVSECDSGIYDAMNKGVAKATGKFLIFMGADDEFVSESVLSRVHEELQAVGDSIDVLLGMADVGRESSFKSSVGLKTLILNSVHHQAAFYNSRLFDNFKYSLRSPVVADYELNVRLYLHKARCAEIGIVISRCGQEGVSHTTNELTLYNDYHLIRSHYMPSPISRLLWAIGVLNVLRRRLAPRG